MAALKATQKVSITLTFAEWKHLDDEIVRMGTTVSEICSNITRNYIARKQEKEDEKNR